MILSKCWQLFLRALYPHSFKFFLFREFLSHNLWYEPEECLQVLLKKHLYVVALELVKVHSLQEIFLKELLTVDDWPLTGFTSYKAVLTITFSQ